MSRFDPEEDYASLLDVVYKCKLCSNAKQSTSESQYFSNIDDWHSHMKMTHSSTKISSNELSSNIANIPASSVEELHPDGKAFSSVIVSEHSKCPDSEDKRLSKRKRRRPMKHCDFSCDQWSCKSKKTKYMADQVTSLFNQQVEIENGRTGIKRDFKTSRKFNSNLNQPQKEKKSKHNGANNISKKTSVKSLKESTSGKSNKCHLCTSRFSTANELTLHTSCHYEGRFKCIYCDFSSPTWHPIKVHLETHNDPDAYKCEDCNQLFSSQHSLYNHRRFNHFGGTHECSICGFKANSKYLLVQHQLQSHDNSLACTYCGNKYGNQLDLDKHIEEKHCTGFTCKYCKPNDPLFKMAHSSKDDLLTHVNQEHNGAKCFFCSKCNYVAKYKHHLDKHVLTHTSIKPYGCTFENCSFRTKDHRNLKQHMMMKHRKPGEMVCRQCRFVTTLQNEWDVHQAMFHMKVFVCDQCPYKSRSPAAIRRHKLGKHTAEEKMRYPCPKCDYKSNFRENLQKHLLTHLLKVSTFKCPFCKVTQSERSIMEEHLNKDHPKKTFYFCPDCSYIGKSRAVLKQHSKTHSNVKPFSCSICEYSSRTKCLLQRHILHKHQPTKSIDETCESEANNPKKSDSLDPVSMSEQMPTNTDVSSTSNPASNVDYPDLISSENHTIATTKEKSLSSKPKKLSSAQQSKLVQMEMRQISGHPIPDAFPNQHQTESSPTSALLPVPRSSQQHQPHSIMLLPSQNTPLSGMTTSHALSNFVVVDGGQFPLPPIINSTSAANSLVGRLPSYDISSEPIRPLMEELNFNS